MFMRCLKPVTSHNFAYALNDSIVFDLYVFSRFLSLIVIAFAVFRASFPIFFSLSIHL